MKPIDVFFTCILFGLVIGLAISHGRLSHQENIKIIEQLSGLNERLDNIYQCQTYEEAVLSK